MLIDHKGRTVPASKEVPRWQLAKCREVLTVGSLKKAPKGFFSLETRAVLR